MFAPTETRKHQISGYEDDVQFIDDDESYLDWLEENPHGSVDNSYRQPTGSYVNLHRSFCWHINHDGGTKWTKDYIQTCSVDPAALDAWAMEAMKGQRNRLLHRYYRDLEDRTEGLRWLLMESDAVPRPRLSGSFMGSTGRLHDADTHCVDKRRSIRPACNSLRLLPPAMPRGPRRCRPYEVPARA